MKNIIDELTKSEIYVVVTENAIAFRGDTLMIAAVLATAAQQNEVFKKALTLAVDAYNEFQAQQN